MKYNMSEIMKRAHQIKSENTDNIWSLCLKMACEEAKNNSGKVTKCQLIAILSNMVDEKNSYDNGYYYSKSVKDWNNYGKSRTYFTMYEKRTAKWSKHNKVTDFGYIDNQTGEYFPTKYGDLRWYA